MPRSLQDIIDHADELAAGAERYIPKPEDETDPKATSELMRAVVARGQAEQRVLNAVISARQTGMTWAQIGAVFALTGEATRERYAPLVAAATARQAS